VLGDLIIREASLSEKDHLGSGHHKIRQRIFIRAPQQFLSLFSGEDDLVWTFTRQR
jgi:hypothetical protein